MNAERSGGFGRLMRSPLESDYTPPMKNAGDWIAAAGALLFIISVFALNWMSVGVDVNKIGNIPVFGPLLKLIPKSLTNTVQGGLARKEFSLFVSPWAWAMLAVLILLLCGIYFVQSQGGITLGVGVLCLLFNVVFFIGAWHKINAVIGNIADIARSLPFIGPTLAELTEKTLKEVLSVKVSAGFYLFIVAGVLLIVGGAVRLASGSRRGQVHP